MFIKLANMFAFGAMVFGGLMHSVLGQQQRLAAAIIGPGTGRLGGGFAQSNSAPAGNPMNPNQDAILTPIGLGRLQNFSRNNSMSTFRREFTANRGNSTPKALI